MRSLYVFSISSVETIFLFARTERINLAVFACEQLAFTVSHLVSVKKLRFASVKDCIFPTIFRISFFEVSEEFSCFVKMVKHSDFYVIQVFNEMLLLKFIITQLRLFQKRFEMSYWRLQVSDLFTLMRHACNRVSMRGWFANLI